MAPIEIIVIIILIAGFGWLIWKLSEIARSRADTAAAQQEILRLSQENARLEEKNSAAEEKQIRIDELEQHIQLLSDEKAELLSQITGLKTTLEQERKAASEKQKNLEDIKKEFTAEFKILAGSIMEDNSKKFTEQNKTGIDAILKPLSEKIKEFEKRINETHDTNLKDRGKLINELQNLQKLNKQLTEDAENLTTALKGKAKVQGNWGEMILERIFEAAGLESPREYERQFSTTNQDGKRYQPDFIVHLPQNRDVIIDSKVSLKAYEQYCSAESDAQQEKALKEHINSVKRHIKELADKDYSNLQGIKNLDDLLMFIPIESACSLAVQNAPEIIDMAISSNILIATPTNLMASLRVIKNLWRQDKQNRNAIEIADEAGKLHDKFVAFYNDMEKLGSNLSTAEKSYNAAINKLKTGRGNIVARTVKLKELGAKTSKAVSADLIEDALENDTKELPQP
ncbi:DNA recombination protein RmuC [Limihaloglobus sulfuriphilus]|uniref:DNA recombination protein RmuC n=1 Tax=Limihaloglobus sulfuriphilus TaxID=1851148 RepID=A0A1Q2MCW4_9BACT|nr:DNA recombination protein RmuC [Limihaloglobus sulfuriphilus]AQQ70147.1 DNA recombination protein RmuC [Limihaloglobus sulfuriphilus]